MAHAMNCVRKMSVVSIRDMIHASAEVTNTSTATRPAAAPATERTSRNVAHAALKPASASGSRTAHSFTPKTVSDAATAQ
jgi:hypothetical protein